ncbi:hypothetical protein IU487_33560 [Nocardia puris]|nr:hypothetical protein [Nocardia puris]MBF6215928.1 hypothetical protein [Nocardia puris]
MPTTSTTSACPPIPAVPPPAMPTYALVRVEHDADPVGCSPHGLDYRLMPAEVDTTSFRWILADGAWAAGGRHALLTRTVRERVPGAPIRIPIHDHTPDTGRRWTPTP